MVSPAPAVPLVVLWLGWVLCTGLANAQLASPARPASHAQTAPAKPAPAAARAAVGPTWAELSVAQRQSLQPLAAQWGSLSEGQKRKWIALSKNYANLSPPDQAKLHSRMTEWVALSPQQRSQARLNFADSNAKQLSPDDKKAKWEAYQSLSPEQKKRLAERAAPKPGGAAGTVKPVPAQKLTRLPKHKVNPAEAPAKPPPPVDHNTLLPLQPAH